ncbi:MAG: leucine-rich repeat domain-containing protein [Treponema sp.]|nr:leucine-rich repeat domain-containing protein [Treponema sp.]
MYSGGGGLTSCSNSSNSDNGKLENNENTGSGGNTDDGGKVEREITAQYEAEGGAVLLTFYDDGTFEFKNDKGYVSKGTYTKSGGKITGTLTSDGYTGFEFEFDTSTGNVKMNDMLITGFEEVTTPSDPNDKDNPSNPKPNEPGIVVPEYLELKGTVIIKFIESELPDDGAVEIPEGVTGITNSEVFYFKKKIKSVTIPSTMTKISDRAFKLCENLESVEISDGVKEIGKYAFYECTSLKSVNIPSSVTTIGEEAFYRCTNLTSVTFEDPVGWYDSNGGINVSNPTKNAANLKSSWASSGIYKDNSKPGDPETGNSNIVVPDYLDLKGTIITGFDASKLPDDGAVEIPEGVTGIDPDYQVFYFNEKIKTVTIPSTMTTIRDQAFERCFGLESVNIADGVKVIGEGAFESCRILKSVKIPNSVTTIGKKAFYYCENLTDITIPAGVTEISDYAFHDCKLTEITIPDGVTKIGENAFSLCPLTEVNIPSSVTTIGYSAFRDCSNLTDITIPKGVTEISNYAFYNCNLKEITIPASVTKIGIAAFAKNFLKSVTFEDTEGWYDNNEEEIDVSDPTKNAKNLESSWGIYKKTN